MEGGGSTLSSRINAVDLLFSLSCAMVALQNPGRQQETWHWRPPGNSLCRKPPRLVFGPYTCKSGPNSQTSWLHVSILYTDWFVGGRVCDVSVLNIACFVAGLSAAVSLFSGGAVPPSCSILFQPLGKQLESLCIFLCCPGSFR